MKSESHDGILRERGIRVAVLRSMVDAVRRCLMSVYSHRIIAGVAHRQCIRLGRLKKPFIRFHPSLSFANDGGVHHNL